MGLLDQMNPCEWDSWAAEIGLIGFATSLTCLERKRAMRASNKQSLRSLLTALLVVAGCDRGTGVDAIDDERLAHADRDTANWLTHGRTLNEQRILTFALGGTATLSVPPFGHDAPPSPIQGGKASQAIIAEGRVLYDTYCFNCHGVAVVAGALPDLRYATADVHRDFEAIVLGGGLAHHSGCRPSETCCRRRKRGRSTSTCLTASVPQQRPLADEWSVQLNRFGPDIVITPPPGGAQGTRIIAWSAT
jgi:hypothetical protein